MQGVAANLAARMEQRYERSRFAEVDRPLRGAAPRRARASRARAADRPGAAGQGARHGQSLASVDRGPRPPVLDRMPQLLFDQEAFGRLTRDLLAALNLADQLDQREDDEKSPNETESDEDAAEGAEENADGEARADAAADARADQEAMSEESLDDSEDGTNDRLDRDADSSELPRRSEPWRPNLSVLDNPEAFGYKVFTRAYDEIVNAEELCDADELDRLRAFLDKQLQTLHGAVARLANRLQRRLLAQQNRGWDFDLEEGTLDAARLARVIVDPMHPAHLQAGARHPVPRHRGHAAARQFRLDARAPDHGRRLLRRYSRPHARALRRQGGDPRLHHARLEGRPCARGVAQRAEAGAARPPQRSPPHRLQIRRRAVAAVAPQSRADDARGPAQGEYRRRGARLGASRVCWRGPEQRRILMMISDGAPVDDSTLSVNSGSYLERHLRQVIEEIETRSSGRAARHRHRP